MKAALEAKEEAVKAARRYAKAAAKVEDAWSEAQSLGALPEKKNRFKYSEKINSRISLKNGFCISSVKWQVPCFQGGVE